MKRVVLAITCGEPAGIGPEIALKAAWALRGEVRCVLIGDAALLSQTAELIDTSMALTATSQHALFITGLPQEVNNKLTVIDCPMMEPVVPGQLNPRNGHAVLEMLDVAIKGCVEHLFDGMVTGPLQKSTINDAGVPFTGHTEYLAEKTNTDQVVMMLAGGTNPYLRVALATTHLPLKDVSAAITKESLLKTITIIDHDLKNKFGIAAPRILVTGLNPHAGENGYLGHEEIDVITPTLIQAKQLGIDVAGPYPADTLFQHKYLDQADCVLAMYHDQGLPVLKFASFGAGVNITLGLPIIRTSVDHGTALDLAAQGVGLANHGSMIEAIKVAAHMAQHHRQSEL